jgi:hypothetical protein
MRAVLSTTPPLPVDTITGINLATLGTDFIRGAPAYLMQAVRECLGELNLSNFRRPLRSYPIRAPTSYSVCCAASAAREVTPRRLTLASGPGMGDHQPYFTHGRLSKSLRLAGKYAVGNLSTHVWVSWVRGASRSQLAWTISTPCAERKRGLCNAERFTRYLVEVCEGRLTNHTTRRRCPTTKLLLTLRPTHHHLRQNAGTGAPKPSDALRHYAAIRSWARSAMGSAPRCTVHPRSAGSVGGLLKGQRKDEVMHQYLVGFDREEECCSSGGCRRRPRCFAPSDAATPTVTPIRGS